MVAEKNFERIFIWTSPAPLLFTIIVPVIINVVLNFSPAARAASIVITQVGLALSGLFILGGFYLTARAALNKQRVSSLRLMLATVISGFPGAVFALSFLILAR